MLKNIDFFGREKRCYLCQHATPSFPLYSHFCSWLLMITADKNQYYERFIKSFLTLKDKQDEIPSIDILLRNSNGSPE